LKNRHPFITHFYGKYQDQDDQGYGYNDEASIKLVMELSEGSDLEKHLFSSNKVLDSWKTKWRIAKEIAQGMCFLHANNVLHRDLKTSNILVRRNYTIQSMRIK